MNQVNQRRTNAASKDADSGEERIERSNKKHRPPSTFDFKRPTLKGVLTGICVLISISYLTTTSFTFGYEIEIPNWRRYLPRKELLLSEEELSRYDGSDPSLPIYVAVNGEVFDVTAGPAYQKGGSYNFFTGRDGSRAFATGCFKTHLTHDLRGLTTDQVTSIREWADFYRNHLQYFYVGKVVQRPIDPNSPIPEDCQASKKPQ